MSRILSSLLFMVGMLLLATGPVAGAEAGRTEQLDAAFDNANKLYEQGKFPEAARAYEQIIAAGSNGDRKSWYARMQAVRMCRTITHAPHEAIRVEFCGGQR